MAEDYVYCAFEESMTTFTMLRIREESFIKATGRLNFIRHIQAYDAYLLKSKSFLQMLKYVLRGSFTLVEENEEYSFEPSEDGWQVIYPGGFFEFNGDTDVLNIIAGDLKIGDLMKDLKLDIILTYESKKNLTILSEMLRKNTIDQAEYNRINIHAEQTNDVRVKDMLKIVKNHFRTSNNSKLSIDVHIIE